jgi:hypothetical protein
MIWEDELDPPLQAVPNQQESNNIDKEIAGRRLSDFPLQGMLRIDVAPVVPNRMSVTLSCEEVGKINSVWP